MNEFCRFSQINSGAINGSVVATAVITDNEIRDLESKAFVFRDWTKINFDNNIVLNLHSSFLDVAQISSYTQDHEFTFKGNEVWNIRKGAFDFLPEITDTVENFKFDNNFFNETCRCDIEAWLESLLNSANVEYILNTSFCNVNDLISKCFELKMGLINMQNFTELVCTDKADLICVPYIGETKVLDTTATMLLDEKPEPSNNNFALILALIIGLIIMAVCATLIIVSIRGGLWLNKKGYCVRFRNMHYNQSQNNNDDEGEEIVPEEQTETIDLPEELTQELLQELRQKLENPETHQEACEMIEKLYDLFVIEDSYTNNNRPEDETHLYEELGNLQTTQLQQTTNLTNQNSEAILKLIEDKFNPPPNEKGPKPDLITVYSEPQDAAVHLYSELQNKNLIESEKEKKSSLKSNSSSRMAFRPLPDKPNNKDEAGPSSKY